MAKAACAPEGDRGASSIPAGFATTMPGGNIGSMHSINFYPEFASHPGLVGTGLGIGQRRGVNRLFLCEYGAPYLGLDDVPRLFKRKKKFAAPRPLGILHAEWKRSVPG